MTRNKLDQPHGRGDFFKSLGTLLAGFVARRVEDAVVAAGPKLLRPPGALEELDFLLACSRCDKCLAACPQGTLFKAGHQAGLAAGTPVLDPRAVPCFLCTSLPCVTACPDGALVWPRLKAAGQQLEGPAAVRIGLARVKPRLCLTWTAPDRPAQACRTCVDRCPYPGAAIRLGEPGENGIAHPVVSAEFCTGCGLCSFGCPVPEPAIVVERQS
jgi:MauM/NapG family ferredoxin protein